MVRTLTVTETAARVRRGPRQARMVRTPTVTRDSGPRQARLVRTRTVTETPARVRRAWSARQP
jgi:hypothetical protein